MHRKSLNRCTLNFNQKDIELEYRTHFAESSSSDRQNFSKLEENKTYNCHFRYSGLFIDIFVSALIFFIVSLVMFFGLENHKPNIFFIFYFPFATIFLLIIIFLICFPYLNQKILSCINLWASYHILGNYFL